MNDALQRRAEFSRAAACDFTLEHVAAAVEL